MNCCFCGKEIKGYGNSTWPIYQDSDGEKNRCCDKCNSEYVITARINPLAIMTIREAFGIKYANQ